MKVAVLTIKREAFLGLENNARLFLIQILHMATEIDILRKSVVASHNGLEEMSTMHKSAQFIQATFFAKELAGKLYEGWQLLNHSYFGTVLSKKYDAVLQPSALASLATIKNYFSRQNIVKDIRDNYSFHYGRQRAIDDLDCAPDIEELRLFIPEGGANMYAEFSELAVNWSLLQRTGGTADEAFKRILMDIGVLSDHFANFAHQFAGYVFKAIGVVVANLDTQDAVEISQIRFPYFISKRSDQA